MKQIQWGFIKPGSLFYSEKALAIKFNVSHSTAKNALIVAEALGMLKPLKGKGRIVRSFDKQFYITKYISSNTENIRVKKRTYEMLTQSEKDKFSKFVSNKKVKYFIVLDVFYKSVFTGRLFSATYEKKLFDTYFDSENSFLDSLRKSNQLVSKIENSIFIEDSKPIVRRFLWNTKNILIEEAYLVIEPKYFFLYSRIDFPFS